MDGAFGAKTLAAVKHVQGCAHIVADGVIGPETWRVLATWSKNPNFLC